MTGEQELLEYLEENIKMGKEALETLANKLEKTDNKIKSAVIESLDEYNKYDKMCKTLLGSQDTKEKKGNLFAVLMTKMGAGADFAKDNSDSHIADMLIQGYNMGIIDITKKLKKYKKEISKETSVLATNYRSMMEKRIEVMKEYL